MRLATRVSRAGGDLSSESLDRPHARCFEPIDVPDCPLDGVQIHFIVAVPQMVAEPSDRAPRHIGLMQFGQSTQLPGSFRYLEKAHSNGVVGHALIGKHSFQSAAAS